MMNNEKKLTPEEQHRRQVWLEIWLPLLVGLVICAAIIVLVIMAATHGDSSIAQWSAVSIILMIIPSLFTCLVLIALAFFLDYWLIKGNRNLPGYAKNIRQKVDQVASKIQQVLLSIVSFLVNLESAFLKIKMFFSSSKPPKN
jgi:heme/copper-type cytochrome/quinol oxidase subunit 2